MAADPVRTETIDSTENVTNDFDREVETLRASPAFQRFLEERSRSTGRVPLEALEAAVDAELEAQGEK